MGNNKKKKTVATVGAVALAATLVLTGTYAWNSISQKAKNENTVYANPGGRLHDDWNGSAPKNGVKRVYVENFTEETYTDAKNGTVQTDPNATAIYVRVKLQTYMEYGEEAGKVDAQGDPVSGRNAKPLVAGSEMGETDTWPVYIKGQSSAFQSYFTLETQENTKLKYMPTFNKNKESLLADINGTYEGESSTTDHFDDYTDWETYSETYTPSSGGAAVTGKQQDAYYYLKGGTAAANTTPGDETEHVVNTKEGHQISETLATSKIITMDQWLAYDGMTSGQEKNGDYWIYDEDGWAYWANPVKPGEATGPLLTDVKMKNSLGGNCYYAINVTGEFASAGDWGKKGASSDKELGFYKNGITDDAITLLNTLAQTSSADWVDVTATSDGATANTSTNTIVVEPGASVKLDGKVTLMGDEVSNQNMTWSLDEENVTGDTTKLSSTAGASTTLTIDPNETPKTLKVKVVPDANSKVEVIYKIKIAKPDTVSITNAPERIAPGASNITLTADVKRNSKAYSNQAVTWSMTGAQKGSFINPSTGELSVPAGEISGTTLKVTAKSAMDNSVLDTKEIRVTKSKLPLDTLKTMDKVKVTADGVLEGSTEGPNGSILGNANNTKTIEIDGVKFFVIAKKDGKALLLSEKKYKEIVFFSTAIDSTTADANRNRWKDSTIRAYLNSTAAAYEPIDADGNPDGGRTYTSAPEGWLSDKPTLAVAAITTEFKTLQEFDDDVTDGSKIDTTKDKIFFLSEADVFGSTGNTAEASVPASFYTVRKNDSGTEKGVKLVAPNGTWIPENASDTTTSYKWWWLRSPRYHASSVAGVDNIGELARNWYSHPAGGGVRPACWIDL